jgi:G protein beta subunit-like protein
MTANGHVKVWDLSSGGGGGNNKKDSGCIQQIRPAGRDTGGCLIRTSIQAVDISEDSRTLVAVSNHGTVYAWNPTVSYFDKPELAKFRAHPQQGSYCLHAKIAPDCRHLCTTGSDGTAKLWDTQTWELSHCLKDSKWVWDAAFCADSSYLVTASSDSTARLWNLRTGEVVRQYHGHQSAVTCVALED